MEPKLIRLKNRVLAKFKAPVKMPLSEWAEANVYLPREVGGIDGPYRLSKCPYQKEILDCFTDKRYEFITFQAGSQLGKTLLLLIANHYYIVEDPAPALLLQPSEKLASALSDQRFRPYIRDNKSLKKILEGQESKSNITEKIFPGGYLAFGSVQTISDLISRPIRLLFLDEVSSYPINLKEKGNPISLAIARTASSFRYNRKVVTTSTPGLEGLCNITEAYSKSDQRTYQVPCPFCSEFFEFADDPLNPMAHVEWEKGSEGAGAWYECHYCKAHILDSHKDWMLANGRWKINNPSVKNHAGFKLNGFYSPFVTFEDIAIRYRAAKEKSNLGNYADLVTFYNQTLCCTWNDQHMSNIGSHELVDRQEYYPSEVPATCGYLTAGIDMQGDRAEITVVGHAKDDQIYIINHFVVYGSPYIDPSLQSSTLYKSIDNLLKRPFKHESGRDMYVRQAWVDCGDGNMYENVVKFCLPRASRGIFACKGSSNTADPIFADRLVDKKTKKQVGFWLGSNSGKADIYARLRLTSTDSPNYIHFPKGVPTINDTYFEQLLSEVIRHEVNARGIRQSVYKKKYESIRNEALDCLNMALGAAKHFMYDKDPNLVQLLVEELSKEITETRESRESREDLTSTTAYVDPSINLAPPMKLLPNQPRFKIPTRFGR